MLVVKTCLKEIKGKGIGLIANEFIKKGQKVWVYNPIVDIIIDEKSIPKEAKAFYDKYAIYIDGGKKRFLNTDNARFINHSKNPNTKNLGRFKPNVAIKDISPGEEITIDYITYLDASCFSPILSPDKKKLLFTSELDGVRNMWELKVDENKFDNKIKRVSRFITSAFSPVFLDSSALTFSGFENFSINIYTMNNYEHSIDSVEYIDMEMERAKGIWKANLIQLPSERKRLEYKKNYSQEVMAKEHHNAAQSKNGKVSPLF